MHKLLTVNSPGSSPNLSNPWMHWIQPFAGTALIVFTLAAYYSYGTIRHLTLESLRQNAFEDVKHGADEIDTWLVKLKSQTEAIANTPTVLTLDWSKIEPYFLDELKRNQESFKLSLLGKDRYLIANTSVGLQRKDLRHRHYLKEALKGKTFVSDAVVSSTTGVPQILITAPIWSDVPPAPSLVEESDAIELKPSILGAVNNAVTIELVSKVVSRLKYGPDSYAFVLNSNGQTMVHPDAQRMSTQEEPTASLLDNANTDLAAIAKRMVARQEGIELLNIDGKLQYIAYLPSKEANWTIAFVIPKNNIEHQLQPLDLIAFAFGVLVISLGAVLWRLQATRHQQLRHIQALTEAANQALEIKVQERTIELERAKERVQVTLESIGDAVITTDAKGHVDYLNPVAEILTGWTLESARGAPLPKVFRIINEYNREPVTDPVTRCLAEGCIVGLANHTVLINRHGQEFAIEDSAAPIRDANNQVLGAVLVFHDVSEQRRLQKEISHQAQHDALTGLFNRYEFEHRLQQVIEMAQSQDSEHALCYLDLDQFKVVNDTCGHAAGDALLQQLSVLLESKIRQCDTLARLGGDEFGVLLEHCSLANAKSIANTLRQAVEDFSFSWQEQRFRVGVSLGLVRVDAMSTSVANILQAADNACYVAKDSGRNRVHVYLEHDEMLAQRYGEMKWVSRIQKALEEDRFELYAQPIFPLNERVADSLHCELLLRMKEEDGKVSLPGAFIPAAERYNLAVAIDRWVVSHAFLWLATHSNVLERLALITINLSGQSIGDQFFHAYVVKQLDDTGIPAKKICFEITETAAIANLADATRFMQTLKSRGCRFSLDDFGSGLSSFGYLKALPVDFLKIDGSFVKDIVDDPIDLAMVRSINEIAQLLNKETIAEYVENDEILNQIRTMGVDYGQGYGLGRPLSLSDFI